MKKRYEEGGEVDALEAANNSADAQEIAGEAALKGMRDSETSKRMRGAETPKKQVASKVRDTGDDVARMLARAPKPAMRQETFAEREKAKFDEGQRIMAAKRAASAEAGAASDANRQSRILTGMKKKPDQNKFMGNTGLKSGGSVSSASKLADGCCTKGKTKGKYL